MQVQPRELTSCEGSPEDESQEHARGGHDEQLAAADALNEERCADGDQEVVDGKAPVDGRLLDCFRDADAVQHSMKIVLDQAVAGDL